MSNQEESYERIDCSCNNDSECGHKIPFTSEERKQVYEGLAANFPDILKEDIMKYLYNTENAAMT